MLGGWLFGGLALASVATLQLAEPARAQDRMQLGAPLLYEFQTEAGDRVFFAEGSAEIGARARAAIEAQAAWLVRHPQVRVTIEGHADDLGSPRENVEVSQRRANAIRQRLMERGVAATRIEVVAYGRDRPVADCAGPACAAQNRRTVTVLGPARLRPGADSRAQERPALPSRWPPF